MMGVMITVIVAFITDATLPPRRYYVLRQSFAYGMTTVSRSTVHASSINVNVGGR